MAMKRQRSVKRGLVIGGESRIAYRLDQMIVAPPAQERVLRAEPGPQDLERGPRVVVEATPNFIQDAGIPAPTARRFLRVLRAHGVLTDLRAGRGRRAAVLAFPALLNIAEGREVL